MPWKDWTGKLGTDGTFLCFPRFVAPCRAGADARSPRVSFEGTFVLGTIDLEVMQQSSLHSARTLPPPVRSALEQLLGRPLSDNEVISVRAYQPHEAPSPAQQRAIASELRHYFAKIDERTKDVPASEQEKILDEAIRSVRPGYRSTR
jgi:hypothetical protein